MWPTTVNSVSDAGSSAARLALSHRELLVSNLQLEHGFTSKEELRVCKLDLQDSINGITENLKELVLLNLTKYLHFGV